MSDLPTPPARPNYIAYSRDRDARIVGLLKIHPVTAAQMVRHQWFPSKDTALRRLNRLATRRKIHVLGIVQRSGMGRPETVYGRRAINPKQLLHEVEVTDVCLRLTDTVKRGPWPPDDPFHPDAQVWIKDELFYLEVDRGTMSHRQIERRYRRYDGCPQVVLWVCPSMGRLEGLKKCAAVVRHTALFTTFAEVLATPSGEIWRATTGGTVALPYNRAQNRVDPPATETAGA